MSDQHDEQPTTPIPPAPPAPPAPPVPPAAARPEPTTALPAYGGGVFGAAPEPERRSRVAGWVWPSVAVLALLAGLVGGAVGGAAYQNLNPSSSSGDGLGAVSIETKAPLPADNGSVSAVAQKVLPSTVQIVADTESEEQGATGSGFVLDREGHVVTNNHVIEGADHPGGKVTVVSSDGKRYSAQIVGRTQAYDLAVLKVKGLEGAQPAALGTSTDLRVGEGVVAIGSPLGLANTVTAGIVSSLNRPVSTSGDAEDTTSFINAVQTDAAVNPGNSGGPLVDMRGRIVGINSAIATVAGSSTGQGGNIGVAFAIPVEQVRVSVDEILRDGHASYPVIGATVSSGPDEDGAHVEDVTPGSPAAGAGLEKGDVISAINGHTVSDNASLIVAIRAQMPGDTVKLTVERDGTSRTVQVKLASKVG
ncbi:S1C family serine protease [Nocardioides jiangxiensis]|uniref:Trypsin-like peptidase domain-containing protein n=1 Tax=Nocardioides jiangxiensis TaxID=3064524 RepID=A0ABT9B2H7_9ACTN|nr:trypsin-like peptidase domain-containing protein [Nocardioides sp. WY-20]MDO7868942.1 trypsin-like peptidase domain-containing protein [Nocardioides sp. WY-20]